MDFNIYKDIEKRTNGEIYIGVVGPVRTGKSTFIKQFMDVAVVPNMDDVNEINRTLDELPQSSAGKTIMTTEPKFVPNNAVKINIGNNANMKVRLIDCVGFMVDGAAGYIEEEHERMVKTPWFDYDIPFSKAAEIGTQKVISEHSTIGVVVTSDGSFTDLDVDSYNDALEKTIVELKAINKPFIVLVNSFNPNSDNCQSLVKHISNKYDVTAIGINCKEINEQDISFILEQILFEFPLNEIEFNIPKWIGILDKDHPLLKYIYYYAKEVLSNISKIKDVKHLNIDFDNDFIKNAQINSIDLSSGLLKIDLDIDENYYYETISQMTGNNINNQFELIKLIKDLSENKDSYIKVSDAIEKVKSTGYGIVTPNKDEIILENPELIHSGNKYGVKIKATAPSIHFVNANIVTEISPIIGSKEQAEDLIKFINKEDENENIWETNIFGKSIGQIVNEGINAKIDNLTEETRLRMQGTIEKITNDQSRGVICIVL